GLGKGPSHSGEPLQLLIHRCNQFLLVFMKAGTPLLLRFQADVIFSVEKAGRIRSVIRTAHLTGAFGNFRKRAEQYSSQIGQSDPFRRPRAGGEGAATPDRALAQVRKESGTDPGREP